MFCFSVLQAAMDSMHAASSSDAHQVELAFEEQQVLLKDRQFLFILVFTMHHAYAVENAPCIWSCVKSKQCTHVIPDSSKLSRYTLSNAPNVWLHCVLAV